MLWIHQSTAIRFLNGDAEVVEKAAKLSTVILPLPVVIELLFCAEIFINSLKNLTRYLQFIDVCTFFL